MLFILSPNYHNHSKSVPPVTVYEYLHYSFALNIQSKLSLLWCFSGDSAYPMSERVLTPYPNPVSEEEQQWNVVHKSMRVKVENSFARLNSKWRRLHYLDVATITKAKLIIEACLLLHNFIIDSDLMTN